MNGSISNLSGKVNNFLQFYLYPLMVFKDEIGVPLKLKIKKIEGNDNEIDINENDVIKFNSDRNYLYGYSNNTK